MPLFRLALLPRGQVSTQTPPVGAEHLPLRQSAPNVHGCRLLNKHVSSTNVCPGGHTHALSAELQAAPLLGGHVQDVAPTNAVVEPAPQARQGSTPPGP